MVKFTPKNIAVMFLCVLVTLLLIAQWHFMESTLQLCNSPRLRLATGQLTEGIEESKREGLDIPVLRLSRENLREHTIQVENLCH